MPGTEVAENFLEHPRVVDDRDHTHGVLAHRTAQRVHVPDAEEQVAPAFGGQPGRRRWGNARAAGDQFRRQAALADATHFVGIPAVVADHLRPFVGDVLGDGRQEISGGEHLEVTVDLGVEPGAVDDDVARRLSVIFSTEKGLRRMY